MFITPWWVVAMPYDKWERKEITDEEFWQWLIDPKNDVPKSVIQNWAKVLNKEIA